MNCARHHRSRAFAVSEAEDSPFPPCHQELPTALTGLRNITYLRLRHWASSTRPPRAPCGYRRDPEDPVQARHKGGQTPRRPACSHRPADKRL